MHRLNYYATEHWAAKNAVINDHFPMTRFFHRRFTLSHVSRQDDGKILGEICPISSLPEDVEFLQRKVMKLVWQFNALPITVDWTKLITQYDYKTVHFFHFCCMRWHLKMLYVDRQSNSLGNISEVKGVHIEHFTVIINANHLQNCSILEHHQRLRTT